MTVVCFREKAEDITRLLWLASFQGEVYTFNYYKGLKCKDKQTIFSKNEYLRIYMIMFWSRNLGSCNEVVVMQKIDKKIWLTISDNSSITHQNGNSLDAAGTNGVKSLQRFKHETGILSLKKNTHEKTSEDPVLPCKVFSEAQEVGRTLHKGTSNILASPSLSTSFCITCKHKPLPYTTVYTYNAK